MVDYVDAIATLDAIDEERSTAPDQIDELRQMVELFKPYDGDDRADSEKRTMTNCKCGNCDYVSAAFATPSELGRAASTGIRRAICPRCYSTTMFLGG